MLLLTFRVTDNLYAVDVTRVIEVVPRVDLRPIPRTPAFLAGLLGYRGQVVPVVDLGWLLGSAPCPSRLSTRVILVETIKVGSGIALAESRRSRRHQTKGSNETVLLGLIAEQVNDVIRVDQERVVFPAMRLAEAPYLGAIVRADSHGSDLAQLIEVDYVLSPSLREVLFGGWEKTDERAESQSTLDDRSPVETTDELESGVFPDVDLVVKWGGDRGDGLGAGLR